MGPLIPGTSNPSSRRTSNPTAGFRSDNGELPDLVQREIPDLLDGEVADGDELLECVSPPSLGSGSIRPYMLKRDVARAGPT